MGRLKEALRASGPALLYGFRVWASVCLALYVAHSKNSDIKRSTACRIDGDSESLTYPLAKLADFA
jgi:hypothetical protein